MPRFSYPETDLLYGILKSRRKKIRRFLRRGEIIGRNPYGDASRFFDRAIEELIVSDLRSRGFSGNIVGEEGGIRYGRRRGWIYIDPLDGSLNVVRGIDYYCCSMAYADGPKIQDIRSAVVWDIPNDVFYLAERGRGAYRIRGRKRERLYV